MREFQPGSRESSSSCSAQTTRAQQARHCLEFATRAAGRMRACGQSRFAALAPRELTQKIAAWYEGCSQAVLAGEYSLLEGWLSDHVKQAAQQKFDLGDLVQFLRDCRKIAAEEEHWSDEFLSPIDEIINEMLSREPESVSRASEANLDYRAGVFAAPLCDMEKDPTIASGLSRAAVVAAPAPAQPNLGASVEVAGDRRRIRRVQLRLPVRVRQSLGYLDEVVFTQDVSKSGLLFVTREDYRSESLVKVTYPYFADPGALNEERAAEVVRRGKRDGKYAVAVKFLDMHAA